MKVEELIEKLKRADGRGEVYVAMGNDEWGDLLKEVTDAAIDTDGDVRLYHYDGAALDITEVL